MAGFNRTNVQQNKTIGANEDMFLRAFETTPKLNIATQNEKKNELAKVIVVISNPNTDWEKRVQAMKHFRSLVNSGISETADFHTTTLKSLEIPFQNNICDLRSQVVRETCITIAFLSCRLNQKFARMAEIILPSLIRLIPNSAKIVSSSSLVALRFIIQSTHNSKLINVIRFQLSTSKSKEIHRALCEIAERIITLWSPTVVERHVNDFIEILRLGICDSDAEARQYARRAFEGFTEHFRELADRLYNSLDPQRQRMLNNLNHGGGSTLSINGYGSTTSSLNTIGLTPTTAVASSIAHPTATTNNNNNISSRIKSSLIARTTTATPPNQHHQVVTPSKTINNSGSKIRTPTARSTSAIDVDAQRRARARAVYLNSMYQRPRQLNTISPSPIKSNLPQPTSHLYHSPALVNHNYNNYQQIQPPSSIQKYNNQHDTSSRSSNHSQHQAGTPEQQQQQNQHHHPHSTPNVAEQQQKLKQLQQAALSTGDERDGTPLRDAAAYLSKVITSDAESQIVQAIRYFNSLIEKHPSETVNQLISELMPPLVVGMDNSAISVRKASVFAMVAIYAKVGLPVLEPYLTKLTMTQRKLFEVYIKKFNNENRNTTNSSITNTSA